MQTQITIIISIGSLVHCPCLCSLSLALSYAACSLAVTALCVS